MKGICRLTGLNEDDTFARLIETLKDKITTWDYFVNWRKVIGNVEPLEDELNLLNSLIGKPDIEAEAARLIRQHPQVLAAFPYLLAIRERSIKVLVDVQEFIYQSFDFSTRSPSEAQARELAAFITRSGLGELLRDQRIKSLPDYLIGVEVGLDSNGRKNRGGQLMEAIVETFVAEACTNTGCQYMAQATAPKVRREWGLPVEVDKSSRIIDFAVNRNGRLYFIETNFYGGGGSKLKSTATEYIRMNQYWNRQGIAFIWITDGRGWVSTQRPLREYFDNADYLLNLQMLQDGYLQEALHAD